jgi:predicted nucleic acid-binding protein
MPSTPIGDPDDVPVIACALASHVDVLAAGDKLLLDLGAIDGLPIRAPRELWVILGQKPDRPGKPGNA